MSEVDRLLRPAIALLSSETLQHPTAASSKGKKSHLDCLRVQSGRETAKHTYGGRRRTARITCHLPPKPPLSLQPPSEILNRIRAPLPTTCRERPRRPLPLSAADVSIARHCIGIPSRRDARWCNARRPGRSAQPSTQAVTRSFPSAEPRTGRLQCRRVRVGRRLRRFELDGSHDHTHSDQEVAAGRGQPARWRRRRDLSSRRRSRATCCL